MGFLVPSSEASCGQEREADHGQKCLGLLLVSKTCWRSQTLLEKVLGVGLWEGTAVVRKGWVMGREHVHGFTCN